MRAPLARLHTPLPMVGVAASLSFWLCACADPVEECTARKQAAYREAYPEARYAVALAANERFRRECGLYQSQAEDESGQPKPNLR